MNNITTFDDWWNDIGADLFGIHGFHPAREAWQFALQEGKRRAREEDKEKKYEANIP